MPHSPPSSEGASPGDAAFLEFRHVDKTYDGAHLVLSDFNLAIRKGEFLTLLGASGSGKTTCLMLLAGFERPTGGEILLAGQSVHRLPPHKRNVGVVFQSYAIFPHLTVGENVAYPLKVRRVARADIAQRVARALEIVRLGGFADRRSHQLSGGQLQRVALARAISFNPSLVLMDEPLGALDRQLREEMQYEIKRIHGDLGTTIVYVTHDQDEALVMSDRVALLAAGEIRQIGTPREIYDRPTSSFVAQFIGENNAIPGTVVASAEERCRVACADGTEVAALNVLGLMSGARTRLCVRPESFRLGSDAAACENRTLATVRQAIFHGDHVRLVVDAFGASALVVKIPRHAHEGVRLDPEARVPIGWQARDGRALDAPQECAT